MRHRLTPEEIQHLALDVLARHRATVPPVDVDAIAQAEGLDFGYVPFEKSDAVYYRDVGGHGHAVIHSTQHVTRQRFSKAHELGHHLMDSDDLENSGLFPTAYRGRDRHWAHDYFAGCLLMPRPWVANFFRARGVGLQRDELIDAIARRFHVSRAAAGIRLEQLGMIGAR